MPLTKRHRRIVGGAMLLPAAALLVTTACAGIGGGEDGPADTAAAGEGRAALTAYVDCMARNGVTVQVPTAPPSLVRRGPGASGEPSARPFGTGSPGAGRMFRPPFTRPDGVDEETWQKAQDACRSVLPSMRPGGPGGDGAPGGPGGGAVAAYRTCLRDHGVTLSGPGVAELNTADPATAEALRACAPLRPSARPSAQPGR